MLDGVAVWLTIDSLQQELSDVLFDQLVAEILIETQVSEVAAALSVVRQVLGVLEHVDHELDATMGYLRVAVQHLGDVSQARRRVQLRLRVLGLAAQLHDGVDDVRLDR